MSIPLNLHIAELRHLVNQIAPAETWKATLNSADNLFEPRDDGRIVQSTKSHKNGCSTAVDLMHARYLR